MPVPEPSEADRAKLAELEQRFGSKYEFELDGALYLRARARDSTHPPSADIEDVYRTFIFGQDGARRATTFVYVNVYERSGDFLYQIFYDPGLGRFVKSRTEHY